MDIFWNLFLDALSQRDEESAFFFSFNALEYGYVFFRSWMSSTSYGPAGIWYLYAS